MLDLEPIKAREQAATPGPWSDFCESGDWWISPVDWTGGPREGDFSIDATGLSAGDMLFIAHARQDVPALLAEVERLRVVAEAARDKHQRYCLNTAEIVRNLRAESARVTELQLQIEDWRQQWEAATIRAEVNEAENARLMRVAEAARDYLGTPGAPIDPWLFFKLRDALQAWEEANDDHS